MNHASSWQAGAAKTKFGSALRRIDGVLTSPPIQFPDLSDTVQSYLRIQREREMTDCGYAHVIYDRLIQQIRQFEETLQPDQEIGGYLSSFGTAMLIHIERVGYHDPFLIIFSGYIHDGQKVQLVQHTSQLSVLFTAISVVEKPARRIGFATDRP